MKRALLLGLLPVAACLSSWDRPAPEAPYALAHRVAFTVPCGDGDDRLLASDGVSPPELLLDCQRIYVAAASPNGRWVVLEGAEETTRVLDVRTGSVTELPARWWSWEFVEDTVFGLTGGRLTWDVLDDAEPAEEIEGVRRIWVDVAAQTLVAYGDGAVLFRARDGGGVIPTEVVAPGLAVQAAVHDPVNGRVLFTRDAVVYEVADDGSDRGAPTPRAWGRYFEPPRALQTTPDASVLLIQPPEGRALSVELREPPAELIHRFVGRYFHAVEDCSLDGSRCAPLTLTADGQRALVSGEGGFYATRVDAVEASSPRFVCDGYIHNVRPLVDAAHERALCARDRIGVAPMAGDGETRWLTEALPANDRLEWAAWVDGDERIAWALWSRPADDIALTSEGDTRDLPSTIDLRAVSVDGGPSYRLAPPQPYDYGDDLAFHLSPDRRAVVFEIDGRLAWAPVDGSAADEPTRWLDWGLGDAPHDFVGFITPKEAR